MNEQIIRCPQCGAEIQMTQAFTRQIEETLRQKFEVEGKQRAKEFDLALKTRDKEHEEALTKERTRLEAQAKKMAEESVSVEIKDLRERVTEQSRKLAEAQTQELDLRKRQRELEDREQTLKLQVERTLAEEREKIRKDAADRVVEEHRLKDREKDKQLDDMRIQIEELKRKAEQGSQQAQGEVMELEIEGVLRASFRYDDIEPVGKGKRGGDVFQHVKTNSGQSCGTILWESKRTKNWGSDWIPKLKDDQRAAKTELAVIVSEALPEGVKCIGFVDGIWASDFSSFPGLAIALRQNLLEIAQARSALDGQGGKMELLYNYLSGPEFRRRVEGIVESFTVMKTDLDSEKRAMEKHWAKREKQIERVLHNTAGMYGELQGIVGSALPEVKSLLLTTGDEKPNEG